jgi:hypothetical protein
VVDAAICDGTASQMAMFCDMASRGTEVERAATVIADEVERRHRPGRLADRRQRPGHRDVGIEGFRPGVMERLGLGPDAVLARNPRLVYGRMTGWGQDGPLAPSSRARTRSRAAGSLRSASTTVRPRVASPGA